MKPKIVVLCGSSKYCDIMSVCSWLIEKKENAITMGLHLLPVWYPCGADHLAEQEGIADKMDALHLQKIDIADEIFVVNFKDYIGKSTAREIGHATEKGIKVRWFTHDPIRKEVQQIINEWLAKQ